MLLLIATGGLFGNFILFSSSLQYVSPTASQVIGQLSPVGMMVASVLILKEKMRGTQIIGAIMLILWPADVFQHQLDRNFYPSD
ncbi:Uncharacterized inner membrane transporter yhbE [Kluyvera cryocrescens]|uniref:Uncharacterized inner membrane transporter yhbE n=1 Tax=Kluyvera cryocrescens TaxID=580 RepID=A0A485AW77_KLUCR|nr:Uncharacterized inner membrane transporter yhbE [Kluyvera cryocrescens]